MKRSISVMIVLILFCSWPNFSAANQIDWNQYFLVAHGLGEVDGEMITNSKEAFITNYNNGHRLFEVDLTYTKDGALVARHNVFRVIDGVNTEINVTYSDYKNSLINGKFTPLDVSDLLKLLLDYPDAYLITDTKFIDTRTIEKQFRSLVHVANQLNPLLLDRIIPQIYHEEMYDVIDSIHHFDNVIYTLYLTNSKEDQVIRFVKEKGIKVVVSTPPRFNESFAYQLHQNGIYSFVHTYNNEAEMMALIEKGADGFYTDLLSPHTLTYKQKGTFKLPARTALFDKPNAHYKTEHTLAPQTIHYSEKVNNWHKIDSWVGTKWLYYDATGSTVYLSRKTALYRAAGGGTKPAASVSPQIVTVVEYGQNNWIKVKTWKGDLWLNYTG